MFHFSGRCLVFTVDRFTTGTMAAICPESPVIVLPFLNPNWFTDGQEYGIIRSTGRNKVTPICSLHCSYRSAIEVKTNLLLTPVICNHSEFVSPDAQQLPESVAFIEWEACDSGRKLPATSPCTSVPHHSDLFISLVTSESRSVT